jgi:hypothetical protein
MTGLVIETAGETVADNVRRLVASVERKSFPPAPLPTSPTFGA